MSFPAVMDKGFDLLSVRGVLPILRSSKQAANYTAIAQSRDELMAPNSSPSHSMWPYLVTSGQTNRLSTISIYSHRGTSRVRARILYMNAGALALWREMKMPGSIIGESHRPPWNAILSFGMPFLE
jgi:hypothetical protein